MSEAFITRRGGAGSGKAFAVIGATYPSGATVTCTNGTKTLTTKDTTGTALFVIPEAGTWTVTAVNGSQSTSKSVSITTEGQVESVTLSFELNIVAQGALPTVGTDVLVTNAGNGAQGKAYQLSLASDGGIIFKCLTSNTNYNSTLWYPRKISVKEYSALKLTLLDWYLNSNFPLCIGLASTQTNRTTDNATNFAVASAQKKYSGSTSLPLTLSLDLSSFTSDTEYWVGVSIVGTSQFNDSDFSCGGIKIASFQLV